MLSPIFPPLPEYFNATSDTFSSQSSFDLHGNPFNHFILLHVSEYFNANSDIFSNPASFYLHGNPFTAFLLLNVHHLAQRLFTSLNALTHPIISRLPRLPQKFSYLQHSCCKLEALDPPLFLSYTTFLALLHFIEKALGCHPNPFK